MRTGSRVLLIVLICSGGILVVGGGRGQSFGAPALASPGGFQCSPAPCVLPPTQASEGGGTVTDTPIVSNPLNMKQLLLGSVDYNCSGERSNLGFHLSIDGGSTWQRVLCMPIFTMGGKMWEPVDEPSVGYDRKGTAYIAGLYFCTSCDLHGLIAVQKSTDGTHWSKPFVALRNPGRTFPFETSLAVGTSPGSPRVNSLYVSGVMWLDRGRKNQVAVSHSSDGGTTWKQAAVDAVQTYPATDDFTRMTVAKDGTVSVTWLHCPSGRDAHCKDGTAYMMFSKSADGGDTWSTPQQIATVNMPHDWRLPNASERVYNYPAVGADTSDGPYSGNLYVAMYTWTGTFLQVQVIRSTDGGNTWSKPVPVAPPTATHDQFFPALSVSPTGLVGVSWLDRRNDPANIDYQAFAAISTDGGQSFQPNWQLTTAFSNPETNGTQNNWMGDYTGSTWAGQDFIAAWMDSSNGVDMQEVVGGIRLH